MSEPSAEELFKEVLDVPVDREDILEGVEECPHDSFVMEDGTRVELDPLTEHILELWHDLTSCELIAIETMMAEQLNTPSGMNCYCGISIIALVVICICLLVYLCVVWCLYCFSEDKY